MSETLTDFKKEIEVSRKRRRILEALLYSSITEDLFIFPTIERYIFNELIRGTTEYVTEEESNFVCPRYRVGKDGQKYWSTATDNFEPNMWDYFRQEIARGNEKLNPEMKEVLFKLLEPHWSSDQTGDGAYETELHLHFKVFWLEGITPVMRSTFSLPHSVIHHVETEVLPSLSEPMNDNVQGIGKLMRRYIERDLKYIREYYNW